MSRVLTPNFFESKLRILVDTIWNMQGRIAELKEFEVQWRSLFDGLKAKIGKECTIRIASPSAYRAFHWDRYHILCSDLLSILQNETQNQESVIRQASHFLQVQPLDHYISDEENVSFIRNNRYSFTEEEMRAKTRNIKMQHAEVRLDACKQAMRALYPGIGEDLKPNEGMVKGLVDRVKALSEEIKDARHVFAHKHQEMIVRHKRVGLEKANVENFGRLTNEIFNIVGHIDMVYRQKQYMPMDIDTYSVEVSDQIDIMIFGSISSAISHFCDTTESRDHYSAARAKYFGSDEILSIISTQAPLEG